MFVRWLVGFSFLHNILTVRNDTLPWSYRRNCSILVTWVKCLLVLPFCQGRPGPCPPWRGSPRSPSTPCCQQSYSWVYEINPTFYLLSIYLYIFSSIFLVYLNLSIFFILSIYLHMYLSNLIYLPFSLSIYLSITSGSFPAAFSLVWPASSPPRPSSCSPREPGTKKNLWVSEGKVD